MTQAVLPLLRQHFNIRSIIKSRHLHTVGAGESQIDDRISDLEELSNPTVGLAAHSGQVDVRITAKAETEELAIDLIRPVEDTLRSRLGDWIYGNDQETLEEVSLRSLSTHNWTLAVLEAGLGGNLVSRLTKAKGPFLSGQVLIGDPGPDELQQMTAAYLKSQGAEVGLGVAIQPATDTYKVFMVLITPHATQQLTRLYAGPPEYAAFWAVNHSLDLIRRIPHDI